MGLGAPISGKGCRYAGKRAAIALGESWPAAESPAQIGPSDKTEHEENRYSPLSYLDPSRFWIPYPLLRSSGNTLRNDGFGIVSYLSDPLDANTLFLTAGFDTAGNLGMVEIDWTTLSLGTPINAVFSDKIEFDASTGLDDPYRATRAAVNASFLRGIRASGTPSTAGFGIFDAARGRSERRLRCLCLGLRGSAVCDRVLRAPLVLAPPRLAAFRFRRRTGRQVPPRLAGNDLPDGHRIKGRLRTLLPVRIAAYAVFDEGGAALDGSSVTYGEASFEGMSEYADEAPSELKLLAGVNTELASFPWRRRAISAICISTDCSALFLSEAPPTIRMAALISYSPLC
jgi:hypothetical protein